MWVPSFTPPPILRVIWWNSSPMRCAGRRRSSGPAKLQSVTRFTFNFKKLRMRCSYILAAPETLTARRPSSQRPRTSYAPLIRQSSSRKSSTSPSRCLGNFPENCTSAPSTTIRKSAPALPAFPGRNQYTITASSTRAITAAISSLTQCGNGAAGPSSCASHIPSRTSANASNRSSGKKVNVAAERYPPIASRQS